MGKFPSKPCCIQRAKRERENREREREREQQEFQPESSIRVDKRPKSSTINSINSIINSINSINIIQQTALVSSSLSSANKPTNKLSNFNIL
uniref:Uncharacterized protein n=1 Tax=Pyxicephalus adspersus TaxID=30357 RepID=A0AAV3A0Q2_PYXAD|nr:TPA: hypothetical protein GDO54_017814 [Pyxicephalus adspersus]